MLNMQFQKVYVSANVDIDKEGIIYDHSEKGIFYISSARMRSVRQRKKAADAAVLQRRNVLRHILF